VTASFEKEGVHFVESLDEIPDADAVVVFSAHGTDRTIIQQAKERFKAVYNLECPFVSKIYTEVDTFINKGITTFFYIGKEHHQEGKNVIAYIKSKYATVYVFQTKEEIPQLPKDTEIAVLSQTTLNYRYVQEILQAVKEEYPNAHLPANSDVCKATYERQSVILQNLDKFQTFVVI
jgi:4-hydroxy-3-methylbut-2-enyl diphosphate reductase